MSVVEPPSCIYGDQYVVAQVTRVGVLRPPVAKSRLGPAEKLPGPATQKRFARHGCKCLDELFRSQVSAPAQLLGIPAPLSVQTGVSLRSEERRVGKECRTRWEPCD